MTDRRDHYVGGVMPTIKIPTRNDYETAAGMVKPSGPRGLYTAAEREKVNKIAYSIMTKRETKQ